MVSRSTGISMKPFWDSNTLGIVDTCFPPENLEIGDVISFWRDDYESRILHRIIDIDYNKEWVRTQGDNPKTNSVPDDFTSFDKIYGKEIGVLNVLDDKKVVKVEVPDSEINITNSSWASSTLYFNSSTKIEFKPSENIFFYGVDGEVIGTANRSMTHFSFNSSLCEVYESSESLSLRCD